MEHMPVLKVLADDTRMRIVTLLLAHNYCVRALARKLHISEAAVSQHLKVLREAGLLEGEKKGYFMHYGVNREALRGLAEELSALAGTECKACSPAQGGCGTAEAAKCHNQKCRPCHCGDGEDD
ncbi:MAG: ArsR/SmtB family transcription factor [Oscillospiraceae bacterium]